jgi:O-antigen ligase
MDERIVDRLSSRTKILISIAALPLTATYQVCYLWQGDAFLQAAVLGASLFVFCLSWQRWIWAMYLFIFCIPLFNTLNMILELPWPGINFNAIVLGALTTSWFYHYLWNKPISDKSPGVYLVRTPIDILVLVLLAAVILALPIGWFRFHNILSPGFYNEMPRQFSNVPFFSLLDNYLCFARAWHFWQVAVAYYMICSSLRHRHEVRNVLWICAVTGALVGAYGIFQYLKGYKWVGINWFFQRINASLNGPHAAGIFFATYLPLCTALMIATQSAWRRVLLFVALSLGLAGLWFTGTRSAAFALVIVLSILCFVFWVIALVRSAYARQISVIVGAILLFVIPSYALVFPDRGIASLIVKSPQFKRFTEGLSQLKLDKSGINEWLAFRFFHWTAAAEVIREHPLLGAGLGTFDKLYREVKLPDDSYLTAYTHAIYLDIYAEMGLVALAGFVGLYCVAVVLSWKLYRAREVSWRWKVMGLGMLVALFATYTANFFTSDFYYVLELQLWFALLMGLIVRNYQTYYDPEPESFMRYWRDVFGSLGARIRRSRVQSAVIAGALGIFLLLWCGTVVSAALQGRRFFYQARKYTVIDRFLEYGIYHYEKDTKGNKFARTARTVYKPIRVGDRYLRLYLRADHPDAEERPVGVDVAIDEIEVGSVVLSNRAWRLVRFDLAEWQALHPTNATDRLDIPAVLHVRSSRTWNPYRSRRGLNDLPYGIDLGAIEWGFYSRR